MIRITLRAARVNAGLSLETVAKSLKKNKQTVINWEKGRTAIDLANFQRLSQIYNIPTDNIVLPISLHKMQEKPEKKI